MAAIKKSLFVRKEEKFELTVNRELILDALRARYAIPENAIIEFHVPGGADWSHMGINIDDENPIYVRWEIVTEIAD